MDMEQVRNILTRPDLDRTLYFTRKNKTGNISYSPEVDDGILNELMRHTIEYLSRFFEFEQIHYNPTGYREGTIEICDTDYVGNFQEVVNSFDGGNVEDIEENAENFTFYCIEVEHGDSNIKLFRRVTKFKRLYSKGLLAAFRGNRLNRIDNKMLGLDGEVDLIVFNNEILVLNHTSLERIFRLNEQFSVKANEAIDCIRAANKIINFDLFEEDCLNDQRVQRILTKMLKEDNQLESCFDNFDNIIETINIFELDIEIQNAPTEAIIYEDKRQIMDILRLVRDSYYKSLIQGKPGIDNKI